jgi:hypothetical protein
MFALGLAIATFGLHASESDGSSDFNGAFLTLYGDVDHGRVVFRSYQITPSTRDAFSKACTHGAQIWINGQHFSCLHSEMLKSSPAMQVEVSSDAEKSLSSRYYLVSVQQSTFATLRNLNERERSALQENVGTPEKGAASVHVTAASLSHAKATDGQNRSFVFIPYGKDKDGNRLTYVFAVSNGQSTYAGKLPDWPEKLVTIGRSDAPQAIINLGGNALVIQAYSIWPQVEVEMFVSEGG